MRIALHRMLMPMREVKFLGEVKFLEALEKPWMLYSWVMKGGCRESLSIWGVYSFSEKPKCFSPTRNQGSFLVRISFFNRGDDLDKTRLERIHVVEPKLRVQAVWLVFLLSIYIFLVPFYLFLKLQFTFMIEILTIR